MTRSSPEWFERQREARLQTLLANLFAGPRLKLGRARRHFDELQRQPNIRGAFGTVVVHGEPEVTETGRIWRLWVEARQEPNISPDTPLIIGDVVHNLRGALDHLAWRVVELDGGTPGRNTYFPIADDLPKLERKIREAFGDRLETRELFRAIAAHPGGRGALLHHLHIISNVDKHRMLTPLASASDVDGVVLIDMATNQRHPQPKIRTRPAATLDRRVLDAPPNWGIDARMPMEAKFDLYFAEPGLQEKPLLDMLTELDRKVEETIVAVETWFRDHRCADYRAQRRVRLSRNATPPVEFDS